MLQGATPRAVVRCNIDATMGCNIMIISATGSTVRNALAEARRVAGLTLADSREKIRSGGEDGLYRCHLEGGHIVEVAVWPRAKADAQVA